MFEQIRPGDNVAVKVKKIEPSLGAGPGAAPRTRTVTLYGQAVRKGKLGWLCRWDDGHRPTWENPDHISVVF